MMETFRNLKAVYKYGREFRKYLFFELIGSLLSIGLGILWPIIAAKEVVYLTNNNWEQLIFISAIICAAYIVDGATGVLIRKNTQQFIYGLCRKLEKEVSEEVLKINQTDIDKNSTGVFIQRLGSDVEEIATMFTKGFGKITRLVTSVGVFIAVFIINYIVGLFYLIVAVLLTIIHLIKARKFKEKDRIRRKENEKLTSLSTELIRGTRDIKMLNAKKSFINSLNKQYKVARQAVINMRNVDINYNFIFDIIRAILEFGLMLLMIYLIKDNTLEVAMAIALYSYRYRLMYDVMEVISELLEEVNGFNLSFERVFNLLDNKTFTKEKFGNTHLKKVKGDFEFRDVCFSYENEQDVLDHISFKVDADTTVGFVGPSGAGKTTIFSLLSKLYDVTSGEILIDGHNINELDEDSIRGNITIIGQSPYVFNMSILDNMKIVKSNATFVEIKKACELACLDEFIESLPEKYNTVIGEGGVTLSGGQRQRLAIARALLQKTEIILFDEATSALDNETQKKVQEAIENLKKDYTIMIIAHRFSTIINCDKIFYIEDGKVLDFGTHEELLKRCKKYKKLYESEIKETD
ncbi:MAG: ABC transporter ATP-binding protein [Bacilli bacterium]|nr:ABC transporter ATP-binding protein [Bacilli bacterium]